MTDKKSIAAIRDLIISAEKSIKNAKKILKDVLEENDLSMETKADIDTNWLNSYSSDDSKIIEWVFTGEEMLWADKNKYPVPANYSSKSKLVQWDKLKLTIEPSWKMLYKQIAPIDREFITWLVTKEKDKYQVVCEWKAYDLLTAAVTHFKAEIWSSVTVIIPKWKQATFAAIDAVLPKDV